MKADELGKLLTSGVYRLTYNHYRTGEVETATLTLRPDVCGLKVAHHSPISDVVVGYDVYDKRWKSVYMNTIKVYENVESEYEGMS